MKDKYYAYMGATFCALGILALIATHPEDFGLRVSANEDHNIDSMLNKTTINECYQISGTIYSRDNAHICSILILQKQIDELKIRVEKLENNSK